MRGQKDPLPRLNLRVDVGSTDRFLAAPGRDAGTGRSTVRHVRGLGDLDILRSRFVLVWSAWNTLDDSGFIQMQVSLMEDFGGIGMRYRRVELITRLDRILRELNRGWYYLSLHGPPVWEEGVRGRKEQYRYPLPYGCGENTSTSTPGNPAWLTDKQ